MKSNKTREPQYQSCVEIRDQLGLTELGLMSNQVWYDDPRRLVFLLSRYKFVAKMFSGIRNILEIGCSDAFGTRIVLQEVKQITAIDFDPVFVQDALERMDESWAFECRMHDMLSGPVEELFDAAYSLDVIEHIAKQDEYTFMSNIVKSLVPHGALIIGTPSIQSQTYASLDSKMGHVNCKDALALKEFLRQFFHNVFIFSMNDEVVHTGFYPMSHYLLALCVGVRG